LTGTLLNDLGPQVSVLTTATAGSRSVADLQLMLQAISGHDGHDPEVPPAPGGIGPGT
jgi:Asp-tRNA(Asn)/Glu-tRNA(Gln) amidotransferase A subunit family amidase